jgi:hypothetical protein
LKAEWIRRHPDVPVTHVPPFEEMKTWEVQVPQQSNHTDCGVFMLHYIERFTMNPFVPIDNVCIDSHSTATLMLLYPIFHFYLMCPAAGVAAQIIGETNRYV